MDRNETFEDMREKVKALFEITQKLYDNSGNFPAVNCNTKRLLASLEMLRINLEEA